MIGRRLPVYLVLDTSGSMTGVGIESVRNGVELLLSELRNNPTALETAWMSVITFSATAQQVVPLTPLDQFVAPELNASGPTAFGAALRVAMESIKREVTKTTAEMKGDWKPLIFIMTDGAPTDADWEKAADEFRMSRPGNVIACAAGAQADEAVLKKVADTVLKITNLGADSFAAFFKWVSTSIAVASQKTAQGPAAGAPVTLPPPPPQISIVP